LERVEKIQHTDLHKKVHIHEKYVQDVIEIREQPMIKRFVHPVQQVKIIDDPVYQIEGKDEADLEIEKLLKELREKDSLQQVQVDQKSDVEVHNYEPTKQVERELVKHYVISKPVITEIHEQPIEEVHEQIIQRVIYEKPVLRVVRAERTVTEVVEKTDQLDLSQVYETKYKGKEKATLLPSTTTTTTTVTHNVPTPGSEMLLPAEKLNTQPIGTSGVGSVLKETSEVMAAPSETLVPVTQVTQSASQGREEMTGVKKTGSPVASPSVQNLSSSPLSPLKPLQSESKESLIVMDEKPSSSEQVTTSPTAAAVPLAEQPVASKKKGLSKMGFGASINEEFGKKLSKKKQKEEKK